MFLATDNMALRRNLDLWFESQSIRPLVLGEFEDYALLRAFGETGMGVFPMPSIFRNHIRKQKSLRAIGVTEELRILRHFCRAEATTPGRHCNSQRGPARTMSVIAST